MIPFLTIPSQEAHIMVHSYTKFYPKQIKHIIYKKPVRRIRQGLSPISVQTQNDPHSPQHTQENYLHDSLRRTKRTISDIIIANDFNQFCTFTFAHDRNDIQKCKNKMSDWLKSQQKIHGQFNYLIIPEFHKDKKAIHFHALFNNYKGNTKTANTKNKQVKNITSYRKGFSTLLEIKNKERISTYVKKYITKDMPTFSGKKRYWCSKNLIRPEVVYNYPQIPFLNYNKEYETEMLTIYTTKVNIDVPINKGILWTKLQQKSYQSKHRLKPEKQKNLVASTVT